MWYFWPTILSLTTAMNKQGQRHLSFALFVGINFDYWDHMFYASHQNAFKAILSIFRHFASLGSIFNFD